MRAWAGYIAWVLVATIVATLFFVGADFLDNPVSGFRSGLTIAAYIGALSVATFFVLFVLGYNKYVALVSYPIFFVLGGVVSYYRVNFHATITAAMVEVVLNTNAGEMAGVMDVFLILWMLFCLMISVAMVYFRFAIPRLPHGRIVVPVVVLMGLGYYHADARLHQSINQRYPYNVVHSVAEYCSLQRYRHADRMVMPVACMDVADTIDVVLVLGEAMRADHLSLNGYDRETTPRLSARQNLISIPSVYSEYTYTASSVPHILTPADSLHPEYAYSYASFISNFRSAGFYSAWISNQDLGRPYASFIYEADTAVFANANKSVFVFDRWTDDALYPYVDAVLQRNSARNLMVLHTIGSHWYYNNHVPESMPAFIPITSDRVITDNTAEEVLNSYDNTALYLDYFLDSLIARFEERNAIIIYLSDHGEALGEDGYWLHAGDAEATHWPACLVWYSDRYAHRYPLWVEQIKETRTMYRRTDFLYPFILSAAGMRPDESSLD